MSIKLKRCPFCGGIAAYKTYESAFGPSMMVVQCTRCGCETTTHEAKLDHCAKDDAANDWNQRATVGEWIPIKEKLPENQAPVLVNVSYPDDEYEIHVGFYDPKKGWADEYVGSADPYVETPYLEDEKTGGKVIAWMPLPSCYAEV